MSSPGLAFSPQASGEEADGKVSHLWVAAPSPRPAFSNVGREESASRYGRLATSNLSTVEDVALVTAESSAATNPSELPDKVAVKLRVLLVEDEPADVELALLALRQAGFAPIADVAQTPEGIHRPGAEERL